MPSWKMRTVLPMASRLEVVADEAKAQAAVARRFDRSQEHRRSAVVVISRSTSPSPSKSPQASPRPTS
jgi:hypothetical protein